MPNCGGLNIPCNGYPGSANQRQSQCARQGTRGSCWRQMTRSFGKVSINFACNSDPLDSGGPVIQLRCGCPCMSLISLQPGSRLGSRRNMRRRIDRLGAVDPTQGRSGPSHLGPAGSTEAGSSPGAGTRLIGSRRPRSHRVARSGGMAGACPVLATQLQSFRPR